MTSRPPRRRLALMLAAAVAMSGLIVPAVAAAKPAKVKVMTRNLYLGADLTPAIAAPDVPSAMAAAGDIYKSVVDTNFTARARLLAQEIDNKKPHLIGLQEVSLWRRGQRGAADGPATPATEVVYDFLDPLQRELQRRGLSYRVAVTQREADIELPTDLDADGVAEFDGRLTMRDVILARKGVKTYNKQHENLTPTLPVPTALGTIPVLRGWTAVDVKRGKRKRAKRFRFVNTHLEAFSAYIRREQASKLINGSPAVATKLPVILVGDLNSDPDDPSVDPGPPPIPPAPNADAYNLIVGNETANDGGFADRGVEVNTCCFGPTITDDPPAAFGSRIDHVLSRGRVRELGSSLIGVDPALRTNTGLWPSDHGGVVATLSVR